MLLIKRFIDIDELCVKQGKQDWKKSFESDFKFRSSSSVVDCDFVFCILRGTVDSGWALVHSRIEGNIRDCLKKLQKAPKMSTNRLISQKRQWWHGNVNTFTLSTIKLATFCISQLVVAYREVLERRIFSDLTVFHFLRERTRREVVSSEQAHLDDIRGSPGTSRAKRMRGGEGAPPRIKTKAATAKQLPSE